ncbi:MAG: (2Fe-2S)-binding protein [Clostridia bacterium]|nr:(2Fe-2S)-binding protein [Clostridia bacterium]
MRNVEFILNGKAVSLETSLSRRLLDVLREDFGLTGTKEGCGEGECGACVVFLDGELVNSCLVPMNSVIGKEVQTIEGLAQTKRYRIIEDAFVMAGAVQCGFCTPGMVMATEYLVRRYKHPTNEEIREGLSGNICRCTGYQTILEAVKRVFEEVEDL